MIRHILFWKFTDQVKAEHREAEARLSPELRRDNGRAH